MDAQVGGLRTATAVGPVTCKQFLEHHGQINRATGDDPRLGVGNRQPSAFQRPRREPLQQVGDGWRQPLGSCPHLLWVAACTDGVADLGKIAEVGASTGLCLSSTDSDRSEQRANSDRRQQISVPIDADVKTESAVDLPLS